MSATFTADPLRRRRRTGVEMYAIRHAPLNIVNAGSGITVRHLFCRLVGAGVVAKTKAKYDGTVVRLAAESRRYSDIPFGKIVDGSRLYTTPITNDGVTDALRDLAALYRRSDWRTADRLLEVWCEKDAIRALLQNVTWDLAVPLMVTRGFASESVIQSLVEDTKDVGKPTVILSLNDNDPPDSITLSDILRRARHYAPKAQLYSEQVALTREQVTLCRLPTRPTKREGNSHVASFTDGESIKLDALEPAILQQLLRDAIAQHTGANHLAVMKQAEASERLVLTEVAR